jgi:hypothetical protein
VRKELLDCQTGAFDNIKERTSFHVTVVFWNNDEQMAFDEYFMTPFLAVKFETNGQEYPDNFIRF